MKPVHLQISGHPQSMLEDPGATAGRPYMGFIWGMCRGDLSRVPRSFLNCLGFIWRVCRGDPAVAP